MFSLRDQWIWDFWIIPHDHRYHLFHLQAPRSWPPQARHDHASIGHAVSTNLRDWTPLAPALSPATAPAWDDLALWTGSTIGHNGRFYLFYTGRDRASRVQQIGYAVSRDLHRWSRVADNPCLDPSPRWYQTAAESLPEDYTWRDPYVLKSPGASRFYMFLSARDRRQAPGRQGAIALAESADLVHWTMHPPASSPGWFRDMEVPTVVYARGRWHLFFSVKADWYAPDYPFASRVTGTLCFQSADICGPYLPAASEPVVSWGTCYAARPVADFRARWHLLGWRMGVEEGYPDQVPSYVLGDPQPLQFGPDGAQLAPVRY
ncbi:MAG: hypothetical protein M0Z53_04500 [Thermaerobacter sp.]|nr:hypothetical protein [Thermaerobacter sp.]